MRTVREIQEEERRAIQTAPTYNRLVILGSSEQQWTALQVLLSLG